MRQSLKTWEGINVKKAILWLVMVILCALAILSVASAVKHFCTVGRFEVVGAGRYSEEELIEGLQIEEGEWLYELDLEEIEARMLRNYPFLLEIELSPVFPNRLRVSVTERVTPWYVEISGSKYALNENLLVIDAIEDPTGMTRLILPDVQRVIAGSVPAFAEDETELRKTLEIIDVIRSASYFDRMTEVNVDEKFTVKLGNSEELAYKLEWVKEVLKSDSLAGVESAEIWAENPSQGTPAAPKFPSSVPEEETGGS